MKQKKLYILVFAIFIFLFISIFCICYASPTQELIDGMNPGGGTDDPTKDSSILYLMSKIFSLIQFIGTGISVIIVLKLGISYMISSVEEKAEIKKKAVPILIGSFLIVATVNIMKLIQVAIEDIF